MENSIDHASVQYYVEIRLTLSLFYITDELQSD